MLYIWYAASKELTPSVQPADHPSSTEASFRRRKYKPGHVTILHSSYVQELLIFQGCCRDFVSQKA